MRYLLKNAFNKALQSSFNKIVYVFATLSSLALYALAIHLTSGYPVYFAVRSNMYVLIDLLLSSVNALLIGISLVLFIGIYKNKKMQSDGSILNTLTAMFFSYATTGCYVCGTVLLQSFGIAASLAALPFGGLEIKVFTALLMLYSLMGLSKSYLGICEVERIKKINLSINKAESFSFNINYWNQIKPIFITIVFVVIIYTLPLVLGNIQTDLNSAQAASFCPATGHIK